MRPAVNTFVSFPLGLLWHAFGGAQMQGMHPSLHSTPQSWHSVLRAPRISTEVNHNRLSIWPLVLVSEYILDIVSAV